MKFEEQSVTYLVQTISDGWCEKPLRELVTKLVDGSHNPPPKQDTGVPMLSARNIDNNSIVFDVYRLIAESAFKTEHARTRITAGDVLLTIVGTIGRAAVVSESATPFALQRSVAVLTPGPELLPKFLVYQLQSPAIQRYFEAKARGTAQKGVYLKTLGQTPIQVAPLNQQERIVAEIEKQFSRLDEAVANLKRVKANLKRYKAAVLKAAVEGDLVVANTELDEVKLGAIAGVVDPQPSHRTPPAVADGIPYVGIGDFSKDGRVAVEKARKVSHTVLEEHRARYTLRDGDFVFGKIGTLGRPARLLPPFEYTLSANVVLVQPNNKRVLPEFLFAYMCSPSVASLVQKEAKATTQAAFGIKRIRELMLRLPPLEIQERIVVEIDRRFSLAHGVESQVDNSLKRTEHMRRAVLQKAFSDGM